MTKRLQTKVRLVKCPKCAKILPEPEQVPLYTCGGCGTILQAKYYRNESNDKATRLGSYEQHIAQINGTGQTPESGESSGSSQRSSPAGQQSSDRNGVVQTAVENPHQTSLSESNLLEQKENGEIYNKIDHFDGRNHVATENHEPLSVSYEPMEDADVRDEQFDGIDFENHNQKQVGDGNSDRGRSTKTEFQVPESKEPLQLALDDHTVLENKESQQLAVVNEAIKDEDDRCEQVKGANSAREAFMMNESRDLESNESWKLDAENGAVSDGSNHDMLGEMSQNSHEKIILAKEINCHDITNQLALAKLCEEDDLGNGNGKEQNDFVECIGNQLENINLSSEAPLSTEITQGGEMVSRDLQCDSNSVDNVMQTTRENIENFEHVRSTNEPETLDPIKGSLAYDGSVSSFDGNDDQIPEKQENVKGKILAGNDAVTSYFDAEESPEWNNLPSSRMTYGTSGNQNRAKNSSLMSSDEKNKSTMLEEKESLEQNRIHGRNRIRSNRNGFPPRVPIYYETGSSSSYVHDELPSHQMRHPPYKYEDQEPWLRETYAQKRHIDRRGFPENELLPMYYNYETSGEIYQRSRYPGYIDRRRRAESWSQSGSLPRIPYSGDVFNGRYQIHDRDPYMHRHPDDLRWSAQLPSSGLCCRQGLCAPPSMGTSWDPYDSYPTDLESYGWAHDTISLSDNLQRHNDQIMRRLYLREKRQHVKRHFRPLAGGAPFITCYFCFQVLQLPDDFHHPRRRTHRLKCGACSSILEFSLENEFCLARIPNANEGVETNLASSSRANHSRERSLIAGEVEVQDGEDRKLVSRNSFRGLGREKSKLVSRNSRSEERKEASDDVAGPSVQARQVRVTWQLPTRSKSPLHRLMGYSSPQDLLNGCEVEDEEY